MNKPSRIAWPSLAPIPAPIADMIDKHRQLLRASERLGLDLDNPRDWPAIGAEAGISPPDELEKDRR